MRLEVEQPILDFDDMARVRAISEHTRGKPLFHYFPGSCSAQVTNPPIDPIRESVVMRPGVVCGPAPEPAGRDAVNPQMRLEVEQPILDFDDMARVRAISEHTRGK
ncbi:hypothetical protein CTI14_56225, partial [Methylobacterium radiotolerans]